MKKLMLGLLATAAFSTAAIAAHNPTPADGFKNYGQCRSALAQAQNDVRKNSEEYTAVQAADINGATCVKQANGTFHIVF